MVQEDKGAEGRRTEGESSSAVAAPPADRRLAFLATSYEPISNLLLYKRLYLDAHGMFINPFNMSGGRKKDIHTDVPLKNCSWPYPSWLLLEPKMADRVFVAEL